MRIFQKWSKEMIKFSGRRHTKMGIISTVIGAVTILGFLILSIVSGLAGGNGSLLLGFLGIVLFGLSIFGFILAYKAFHKKDIFYHFPVIGIILNSLMVILLLVIYILGFGKMI